MRPTTDGRFLRDARGRALLLRGVAVSSEGKTTADRLPRASRDDLARVHDALGMSAIRLLAFWEAIEPAPGRYDQGYLAALRGIVEEASAVGLEVVVDMHQDVWGASFGFAGAPGWTVPAPTFRRREPWFLTYFEPAVAASFDRLYRGALCGAFAGAWAALAGALRGAGVLAYELLNEPFWGSHDPSRFERDVAPRAYEIWIDAIRAADPEPLIVVPPASLTNVGRRTRLSLPARERLVYGPHVYPVAVEAGLGFGGDRAGLAAHLDGLIADASRLGAPLLVGELGVRRGVPGADEYLTAALDLLDERLAGALLWDLSRSSDAGYGLWDEEGRDTALSLAVARPHPVRLAGTPRLVRWDRAAMRLAIRVVEPRGAELAHEIAIPGMLARRVRVDGAEIEVERGRFTVPAVGGERSIQVELLSHEASTDPVRHM